MSQPRAKLGDIATFIDYRGKTPTKTKSGIPLITAKNIRPGFVSAEPREYIAESNYDSWMTRGLPEVGDVLITTEAPLGYVACIDWSHKFALAQRVICLKPSAKVLGSFLAKILQSPDFRDLLVGQATGTTVTGIKASRLKQLEVPLPPLTEQRRIVAKLESLQSRSRRARAALNAVPLLLEKLRQSILAAAFRGDLTKDWRAEHPDVEPASELLKRIRVERRKKWEEAERAKKGKRKLPAESERILSEGLPELPSTWTWTPVNDLIARSDDIFDGPFGSSLKTSDYVSDGVRVVRLENVANLEFRGDKATFISTATYEGLKRHSVGEGDIIFGSFVEDSTRVCMLPHLGGGAIAKADCFCVRPDPKVVQTELLLFALGSQHARNELTRGIHGATRPRINTGQLRALSVALPPRDEQLEVVARIESAFAFLQTIAARRRDADAALVQMDRSILAKAFRGELVPQDPNDEPADVMLPRFAAAGHGAVAKGDMPNRQQKKSQGARGAREQET